MMCTAANTDSECFLLYLPARLGKMEIARQRDFRSAECDLQPPLQHWSAISRLTVDLMLLLVLKIVAKLNIIPNIVLKCEIR